MSEPCGNCGKRHRTITAEQCIDRAMSEKKLQDSIRGRARYRGWEVAHAGKALVGEGDDAHWITPMAEGWPDLCLAKAGHRLIFMELKKELGEVDEEQWKWLRLLNRTGNKAVVIRPSDLREGRVTEILNRGYPL
jgi:hypothetical protein